MTSSVSSTSPSERIRLVAARTVSERLADYVVDLKFDDIPPAVIAKTKYHLVHHLGLALRGSGTAPGRRAVSVARRLSAGGGRSTIVGERHAASPLDAVFANSFLMSHDAMDDFQLPTGLHAGVITQPVAWVVGESAGSPGGELLTAVVCGYDVMASLAATVFTWSGPSPRRPNYVFAPIGGAATAARLLSLSREETAHALAHAAHASMGLVEGSEHMRPLHGLLARNGLMAASLAAEGMPMASTMIEGRHGLFQSFFGTVPDDLDASVDKLGHEFMISTAATKRYRSSGLNIVPIELTLDLVRTRPLTASDIAVVEVTLPEERRLRESVWEEGLLQASANGTNRQGSLRFQVATILTDGRFNSARFDQPPDTELSTMLDKVRLEFETGRTFGYARIDVTTTGGDHLVSEGTDHVLPDADWGAWLAEGGERILTSEQLNRLVELIGALEDVADVGEVTACLVPKPTA